METKDQVSIVLPTYNGSKYLKRSIDSCLGQTHPNIELIVVDDGSAEDIGTIVSAYSDDRLTYIRHEKNKGLPAALNTGFSYAHGDYLTWTSDDNYYLPPAIEKMLGFMAENDCSFVYSDLIVFYDYDPSKTDLLKKPDQLSLEKYNGVGACFLYTKEVKDTVGDYDVDSYLAEDFDYWIRVSKKYKMCHIPEPLYYFRSHKGSLTNRFSKDNQIKITDVLVRFKNDVIDTDVAGSILIDLIIERDMGLNPGKWKLLPNLRKKYVTGKIAGSVKNELVELQSKRRTISEVKTRIMDLWV